MRKVNRTKSGKSFPERAKIENQEERERNPLIDVDFSEAILWAVSFTFDCDLSQVIPPQDENHIFYRDWPKSIDAARRKIAEEWNVSYKDLALYHLDWFHDNPMMILNMEYEEYSLINWAKDGGWEKKNNIFKKYLKDYDSLIDFTKKFCDLLKSVENV